MKPILYFLLIACCASAAFAEGVENGGAVLRVNAGYYLVIPGRYAASPAGGAPGQLFLDGGVLALGGDWLNGNAVSAIDPSSTGKVILNGVSSVQTIGGSAATAFYDLEAANTGPGVVLGRDESVTHVLYVTAAPGLDLGGHTLDLGAAGLLSELPGMTAHGGSGAITAVRGILQGDASDQAGLGITIDAAGTDPGSTAIQRLQGALAGPCGYPGITRRYRLTPAATATVTLTCRYDDGDLNGIPSANLVLTRSGDGGATWSDYYRVFTAGPHSITVSGAVIGAGGPIFMLVDRDHAYRWVQFQTDGTPGAYLNGVTSQLLCPGANCAPVWAAAPPGCYFNGWTGTGGFTSASNPLALTGVTGDMSVTAHFHTCPLMSIWPAVLPVGKVGFPYGPVVFNQSGGMGAVTWSLTGTLPVGITFNNGVLAGTPLQEGYFPLEVSVRDTAGCERWRDLALAVTSSFYDLNGDGIVSVQDLLMLAQLLAGNILELPCGAWCADLNADGKVDISDLLEEYRHIFGQ